MRIQQKDHFKQHGLNDLSGCIMTRDEMRLVAVLAWKHFRAECQLNLIQSQFLRKMDFLTGKMRWRKRRHFKSTNRLIHLWKKTRVFEWSKNAHCALSRRWIFYLAVRTTKQLRTWRLSWIESTFHVYQIDDDVPKRLKFVSSRLVSKRLCIGMTGLLLTQGPFRLEE